MMPPAAVVWWGLSAADFATKQNQQATYTRSGQGGRLGCAGQKSATGDAVAGSIAKINQRSRDANGDRRGTRGRIV